MQVSHGGPVGSHKVCDVCVGTSDPKTFPTVTNHIAKICAGEVQVVKTTGVKHFTHAFDTLHNTYQGNVRHAGVYLSLHCLLYKGHFWVRSVPSRRILMPKRSVNSEPYDTAITQGEGLTVVVVYQQSSE